MLSWKFDKFPFFTFFSGFLFLCLWPSLLPIHPVLRQLVLSVWQYYSMLLINVIFQTFERNERYDEGAVEVRGSDWEKPFWENLPKGRCLQLYLIILWMSCGFFCLVFSFKLWEKDQTCAAPATVSGQGQVGGLRTSSDFELYMSKCRKGKEPDGNKKTVFGWGGEGEEVGLSSVVVDRRHMVQNLGWWGLWTCHWAMGRALKKMRNRTKHQNYYPPLIFLKLNYLRQKYLKIVLCSVSLLVFSTVRCSILHPKIHQSISVPIPLIAHGATSVFDI